MEINDKVKIIDNQFIYPSYQNWIDRYGTKKQCKKWVDGYHHSTDGIYVIKAIEQHETAKIDLYLIEDNDSIYIIEEQGIGLFKKTEGKK